MFPALFRIPVSWLPWTGDDAVFPIRMFGVMVILGFLAGTSLVGRRLEKRGVLGRQDAFDFCFYLLAAGIAGSRVLYVLQNFSDFRGHFFQVFAIWEGGLVWYGGFACATVFAFWWTWKRKLPVLVIMDAAAMGLTLSLAIGRWGCFCAGDDYGAKILAEDGSPIVLPEHAPWYAVQFPNPTDGWRYNYSETAPSFRAPHWLYPVQIFMSLSNFVVLGLLFVVSRLRVAIDRPGVIAASYLLLYPIARFVVEFWRGDEARGVDVMGSGLSFSQFFGIPIFLCGVALMRHALKRSHVAA